MDEPFDLYLSPPRKVLSDDSTLSQEQLVPAAKIHVSWKNSKMVTDQHLINPNFYRGDSLSKTSYPGSKNVADELAAAEAQKRSSDGKVKKKLNEADMIARMMGKSKSMASKSNTGTSASSKSKPKWFK